MKWINNIFNNFIAKLIALALAIATWFYIFDVVNSTSLLQKEEIAPHVFSRYHFTMKKVLVEPDFYGTAPKGYCVAFDKVKIVPQEIFIFGPESILKNVAEIGTERIDIGEYTRSTKLDVGLRSDIKFLRTEDKAIEVYLPVETLENAPEPNKGK